MPGKRTRRISLAAAGGLSAVGALSVAMLTLPSMAPAASATAAPASSSSASPASASPAFASLDVATQRGSMGKAHPVNAFDASRFSLGLRQHAAKQAAAKAAQAAARAAAAKAVAEKAAAAVKAQAAAAASGSPQQVARAMLGKFGWSGGQFSCLEPLWGHESRWSVSASNPGSGAYGIPQALPGSRMASAGPDWQTNPGTQIKWGLRYIQSTYGSPCAAWSHEQSAGWY
ncbi:MAG: lytic transglycosylase domain-containing protein [Actinobacteria bacterium]|nr:lytic transglycosylase domain-containing protein [Actinomycetota bacterium]